MQLFKRNRPENDQVIVDENKKIRLLRIDFAKETLGQVITNVKDFKVNYKQYIKEFNWRERTYLYALLGGIAAGTLLAYIKKYMIK